MSKAEHQHETEKGLVWHSMERDRLSSKQIQMVFGQFHEEHLVKLLDLQTANHALQKKQNHVQAAERTNLSG